MFKQISQLQAAGPSRHCRTGARVAHARAGSATANQLSERRPRPENVAGPFYVDHTCIDCDTCRWMDPDVFNRVGNMTAVTRQPTTKEERQRALQALLSCPTYSIHAKPLEKGELQAAHHSMPVPVEGCTDVYHCGFHSELSYGAASYLLRRPEGNILMDSPRYNPALAKRLEELGGVRFMVLSHRDDVADHARWQEHFACTRVMHQTECNARQGTDAVEHKLQGEGPWEDLGADALLLYTPGHTAGCISLLHKPTKTLLSGDHLAWSSRLQRLSIMKAYNWYSVPEQVRSTKLLLDFEWLHLLPGHGRPAHFSSLSQRDAGLRKLLEAESEEVL